jgi:tetratricopeptide (TPR) repeat protein
MEKAIRFFEQALEKDPSYALAYAGLGSSFMIRGRWGYLPPKVAFPKAKANVERALTLDDELPEAHANLGAVRFFFDWDWDGAEQALRHAIGVSPSHVESHIFYGHTLSFLRRTEEAVAMLERALELDPLSAYAHAIYGNTYYFGRRWELATEHCQKALEIHSDSIAPHFLLAATYSCRSMHDEAVRHSEKAVSLSNRAALALGFLGRAFAMAARREDAHVILQELLERSKKEYIPSSAIALLFGWVEEKEQAFEWLEKAYHERDGWLVNLNVAAEFDPLRSDPRFDDILRRMNFPGSEQ